MRFGKTRAQKVEQKAREEAGFKWFAWYPVYLADAGNWIWLERVLKSRARWANEWEYRTLLSGE